jgi:hypothetical protein
MKRDEERDNYLQNTAAIVKIEHPRDTYLRLVLRARRVFDAPHTI